jgi:hypothetical protein
MIEEKTFYEPHSILYYVDRNDPLGKAPSNPEKDPQFELWESRVVAWAEKQAASSSAPIASEPPTEYDNLHRPENIPTLTLVTPGDNQTLLDPVLRVRIQTSAPRGVDRAEYYIDNNLILINRNYPFNMEKDIGFLPNGFHNLIIRVCDDVDNCQSRSLEINLVLESQAGPTNASLGWQTPYNGLAVSNIDFPLGLSLSTDNPRALARIELYYQLENEEKKNPLATIQPIDTNTLSANWQVPPASGTYRVLATATTWQKETIDLEPILLIINNSASAEPTVDDIE